jgi:hypothetical protein
MRKAWILIGAWIALIFGAIFSPYFETSREDQRVRWTADLSLVYYVVATAGMLIIPLPSWRSGVGTKWIRLTWSLAWIAFLIHVVVAFNDYHHWRHADAIAHTREVSGIGSGIYVSYFFTVVWGMDVIWWCLRPSSYGCRAGWLGWCVHGFLAFIALNGAVIYETGPVRWVGSLLAALLMVLLVRRVMLDHKKRPPCAMQGGQS